MEQSEEKNDKGMMKLIYLKQVEKERVKIDEVSDCYEFFVKMLNIENEELHTHEHLWVLGIDEMGYAVCGYIVSLGYSNFSTVEPMKIFKIALQLNAVKIVICQSKCNTEELDLNEADFNITNAIYHKAAILGLELIDHIVISNLSIKSLTPLYYSYLERDLINFVSQDITYKSVIEARAELDQEKKDAVDDALQVEREQIARKLLSKNVAIDVISETTGLSEKEVTSIKLKYIEDAGKALEE